MHEIRERQDGEREIARRPVADREGPARIWARAESVRA
jgi:hypothetical protein